MKDVFFLTLNITTISVSHVCVITFFSNTLVHYAVTTETFIGKIEQGRGGLAYEPSSRDSLDCVAVSLSRL